MRLIETVRSLLKESGAPLILRDMLPHPVSARVYYHIIIIIPLVLFVLVFFCSFFHRSKRWLDGASGNFKASVPFL
jgi:uncharacterized RDD family membrane protein YckC